MRGLHPLTRSCMLARSYTCPRPADRPRPEGTYAAKITSCRGPRRTPGGRPGALLDGGGHGLRLSRRVLDRPAVPPRRSNSQPIRRQFDERDSMSTLTPHLVVRDVTRAAEWYAQALGAQERSRIPLPGGKVLTIELAFGDSTVMIADEFPEQGIVSPLTLGGTYGALQISTDDVDTLWKRALDAGAEVFHPWRTPSGASATARSSTRSATGGACPSTCGTCPRRRSPARRPRSSAPDPARRPDPGRAGARAAHLVRAPRCRTCTGPGSTRRLSRPARRRRP